MASLRPWAVAFAAALVASGAAAQPAALPNLNFDGINYPCIVYNIATAMALGQPIILQRTTNTATQNANRAAICNPQISTWVTGLNQGQPRADWVSCDEYPFASSTNGGLGGQAMIVPLYENSTQGGVLSNFYRTNGIGNGGLFTVTVTNVPQAGGGSGQVNVQQLAPGVWRCAY